jgi:hypothetical protein
MGVRAATTTPGPRCKAPMALGDRGGRSCESAPLEQEQEPPTRFRALAWDEHEHSRAEAPRLLQCAE